jgi:hypothetical protein
VHSLSTRRSCSGTATQQHTLPLTEAQVAIRAMFVSCLGQINNYVDVELLPGLVYYSARATKSTVLATATKLSEQVLAQLALRLAPQQWQSANKTLRNGLPQSLEKSCCSWNYRISRVE